MGFVEFIPFNKKIRLDNKSNLLKLAHKLGLPIRATCSGKGICGKCKVIIKEYSGSLPDPSEEEKQILGKDVKKGYRLACKSILQKDAKVIIPDESQEGHVVILTSKTDHKYKLKLDPIVEEYIIKVPSATLRSPKADSTRLLQSLKDIYGLNCYIKDINILKKLPTFLRENNGNIRVIIHNRKEIIDIIDINDDNGIYGLSIDVGTTTIVVYLIDLTNGKDIGIESELNPQVEFGDDVISRISFIQQEKDGLYILQNKIKESINRMIYNLTNKFNINHRRIYDMTIVGNTVMHHILMGLDPRFLSIAPYTPVTTETHNIKANILGINMAPNGYIHFTPIKAGFLGGDIIAAVLATGIHKSKIETLLVDLGTNGEIVVGNKERMISCSTAAGPAFEGRHIQWGVRAISGAIEKIKINPNNLSISIETIDNKPPVGICGSGLISIVAEMIRSGIILNTGRFNHKITNKRLRNGKKGLEFVISWNSENMVNDDIVITEKDIESLQMAKAAVYAGASLLLEECQDKPKRIYMAGAFGNYIDQEDIKTIGLLPVTEKIKIYSVGNAAGYGASLLLLNKKKRKEIKQIIKNMEYKELSGSKQFNDIYIDAMFFDI